MNMMQDPENEKKTVARVCASKQFPGKLHDLLTYAESSGFDWIISWVHNGKAFMVHSQQHLMQILPIFFGQTKFRSFQRQLNVSTFELSVVILVASARTLRILPTCIYLLTDVAFRTSSSRALQRRFYASVLSTRQQGCVCSYESTSFAVVGNVSTSICSDQRQQ
jgi:HSF-type DNA-binding